MNMQTVRPGIFRPDEIKAHERGGGARTIPLVNRASGTTSFINGITIFEPGAAIPLHKHNCEESVMLLEGKAIAEIDGERHVLEPCISESCQVEGAGSGVATPDPAVAVGSSAPESPCTLQDGLILSQIATTSLHRPVWLKEHQVRITR